MQDLEPVRARLQSELGAEIDRAEDERGDPLAQAVS